MTDARESWLKFLNPDSLKQNLVRSSIYLAAWEMLKESIIDQARDFYVFEWQDGEAIPHPKYKGEVLQLHKDPLIASAFWFRNQDAITDDDITLLKLLRDHRNDIAHELPKFLGTTEANIQLEFLNGIYHLCSKVDKWIIQTVEIPVHFDTPLSEEAMNDAQSMRMILMSLLIAVANGNEDDMRTIYEGFKTQAQAGNRKLG